MLVLSYFLGERHKGRETDYAYESGIKTTENARTPFFAKFYLVAILFVVFDIEVVFLYLWAIASRDLEWKGYIGLLLFIGVLLTGLFYELRMGVFDWFEFPENKNKNKNCE
jgi:NADH-quinone oxidoreductase subunit A